MKLADLNACFALVSEQKSEQIWRFQRCLGLCAEVQLTKAEAVKALRVLTEAGRTACYDALNSEGRFSAHLSETRGLISWKA
jgi:hypothetical protein